MLLAEQWCYTRALFGRTLMRLSTITKTFGAAATLAAVLFLGMMIGPKAGRADNDNNDAQDEKLMISQGMAHLSGAAEYGWQRS